MAMVIDEPSLLVDPERLKLVRHNRGLNYRAISQHVGISHNTLVAYENGDVNIQTLRTTKRLCVVLHDHLGVDLALLNSLMDYHHRFDSGRFKKVLVKKKAKPLWLATYLGVTQSSISIWKRGLSKPDGLRILRLSQALEIEVSEMLSDTSSNLSTVELRPILNKSTQLIQNDTLNYILRFRGIKAEEIAADLSVSVRTVHSWRTSSKKIPMKYMAYLSNKLQVPPEVLLIDHFGDKVLNLVIKEYNQL
jgi:Helix-turn-helix.